MTIPTEVAQLKIETDGTNDPIDLTSEFGALYFLAFADVVVFYRDPEGNETLWALGDDYTLSGNGAEGEGVLTPIAATEAGGHICVFRLTPLVQDLNLEENDGFPAESLERAQDRQIIIDQDSRRMILSAVRGCVCDPPMAALPCAEDRANKCLHFDENGQPVAVDCGNVVQLQFEPDGLGAVIPAGTKRKNYVDFAAEIVGWVMQGSHLGTLEIAVRMKPFATDDPPGPGNSITGATPVRMVNHSDFRSADVEDWTVDVPAGAAFEFEVVDCVDIQWATLNLLMRRL